MLLPNDILKQIRRLQLYARRMVASSLGGEYQSAFKGTGLLFEDVREYQPGDDVRRIDWNVTARAGLPFVKRYIEERELTVLIMLDASASMNFGHTPGRTKRSVAAELAAILAVCAAGHNDRIGLLAYTEQIEKYVAPTKGSRHVVGLLRDILFLAPKKKKSEHNQAFDFLSHTHRNRAIVFWFTDGKGELSIDQMKRIGFKHDVVAICIEDEFEKTLPRLGMIRLRDLETAETRLVDTSASSWQDKYDEKTKKQKTAFEQICQQAHIEILNIDTNGGHLEEMLKFFRKRQNKGRA